MPGLAEASFISSITSTTFFFFFSVVKHVILDEVGRRGQSFSAEAKRKAKGSQYKSSVPSIIVWNVKFLDNKTSEPGVLIMTQREN